MEKESEKTAKKTYEYEVADLEELFQKYKDANKSDYFERIVQFLNLKGAQGWRCSCRVGWSEILFEREVEK